MLRTQLPAVQYNAAPSASLATANRSTVQHTRQLLPALLLYQGEENGIRVRAVCGNRFGETYAGDGRHHPEREV
jgi:hypothetical protein